MPGRHVTTRLPTNAAQRVTLTPRTTTPRAITTSRAAAPSRITLPPRIMTGGGADPRQDALP
jgi:hypothetical protein